MYNKYTHKLIYVPCGQCHECQQRHADAHLSRIYNHERDMNYFRVFITLNYCNEALPYIDILDENNTRTTFNVYRSCQLYYYASHGHSPRRICRPGRKLLGVVSVNQFDNKRCYSEVLDGLLHPQKFSYCDTAVGVIWTKDFSDFMCRFRKNLKRVYKLDTNGNISFYKMAEYGPTTLRPHFHAILYFPASWKQYYQQIKRSIIAAWPYASVRQVSENISIAQSGQRYVSQYCVRPSEYPDFLKIRKISQRPSFSRSFGFNPLYFSSDKILHAFERRALTYTYDYCDKAGHSITTTIPIPKYIIRRYFPFVKGACEMSDSTLHAVLSDPSSLVRLSSYYNYNDIKEAEKYSRSLVIAASRLGVSLIVYAFLYPRVLSMYNSTMLAYSHESVEDYSEFYDNPEMIEYYRHSRCCQVRDNFDNSFPLLYLDCNLYPTRHLKELQVEVKYQEHLKKSKLVDKTISLQTSYITFKISKYYGINSTKTKTFCAVE